MRYQTFTLTIAAGGRDQLDIEAAYISCVSSTLATFHLGINDDTPQEFTQGFYAAAEDGETFRKLVIENRNAVPVTIKLAVGAGRFEDRRLISNAPDGIEPVTLQAIAEKGFIGQASVAGAAGEYSLIQLWNAVGSGRIVAVSSVILSSPQSGTLLVQHNAQAIVASGATLPSVYAGQPNSVSDLRTETTAGNVIGPATFLLSTRIIADTPLRVKFDRPVVMGAGRGLVILHDIVGASLFATFQALEIPG